MTKTIFVTGGTDGWGDDIALALADAGHSVYVGKGQASFEDERVNLGPGGGCRGRAACEKVRTVAFEAVDQHSIAAAVRRIVTEAGGIDVVIHTASPVTLGPVEAFTPYQLSQVYDTAVLSAQRVTRAVLPLMRERREGLLIWMGLGVEPGPAPFTGPGRAVRAALQQLAESYAAELAAFGIDVTFVTYGPGHLLGTAPAPHQPGDSETAKAYYRDVANVLPTPAEQPANPAVHALKVAECVSGIIDARKGARPAHVALWPL
ncbi:SDR family NAD(P)-dependent oxidoreductase [Streptomyces sp. enrichment culture]|uniref:SDR family NAD(P)-dependent oxidoreductase n=1 Tax=Streptomyces sp. enrichment culture TaxID=1795815 RepID=UPI003F55242C